MDIRAISTTPEGAAIFLPTRDEVMGLRVGDLAPTCFGDLARVTEIFAQSYNVKNEAFVCYYTEFGANGSMSHSMTECEIVRTVGLSQHMTSAEIDRMELKLNSERA